MAAIVDRLTFGGIIETGTDSFRRAHTGAKGHQSFAEDTGARPPRHLADHFHDRHREIRMQAFVVLLLTGPSRSVQSQPLRGEF